MARQFHHVIRATVFRGVRTELRRQNARLRSPRLEIAGASGAIGSLARDFVPEVLGNVPVVL